MQLPLPHGVAAAAAAAAGAGWRVEKLTCCFDDGARGKLLVQLGGGSPSPPRLPPALIIRGMAGREHPD
jgi:hypothetical protein